MSLINKPVKHRVTGRTGRIVQDLPSHMRVRWDGLKGYEAVTMVKLEQLELTNDGAAA